MTRVDLDASVGLHLRADETDGADAALQELAARVGAAPPAYSVESVGPDHDRLFTATVRVGEVLTQGTGTSKKSAEMAAALRAWHELGASA